MQALPIAHGPDHRLDDHLRAVARGAGLYDSVDLTKPLLGRAAAASERERREAVDACAGRCPELLAPHAWLIGLLCSRLCRRFRPRLHAVSRGATVARALLGARA
jgi:hypothetical protein